MEATERRERLRRVLKGDQTVILPAVFDAVSARIAEIVGFEIVLLSGSVTAASLLAVPDLILVTMTEVAGLAKRIVDSTSLSLQVDGDHGFGNALNVMRCIREFEGAGVASITIEDTNLPRPYGTKGPSAIPIKEMCGKLKAAVAAREDPLLVIIGRTDTVRYLDLGEALERARAYQETGVDAIFLPGLKTREEFETVRQAISLPLIASGLPAPENGKSGLEILQEIGYCMTLLAKFPFGAAVQAMHDALTYLKTHGEPGPPTSHTCSTALLDTILRAEQHAGYLEQFMNDPEEDLPKMPSK